MTGLIILVLKILLDVIDHDWSSSDVAVGSEVEAPGLLWGNASRIRSRGYEPLPKPARPLNGWLNAEEEHKQWTRWAYRRFIP